MGKAVEIPKEDFRKMQLMQLEMLQELDRVCRQNGIHYVISNGSLLGAVRHKGYIPWDDDADTVMLREDYEKFKKCSNQLNQDICFFQDNTTDPAYRWGYGKLRRTGTTYIREGQEHLNNKTGLFIDIFPLDDVPQGNIAAELQDFLCFCIRKITYSEVAKMSAKGFWKMWWTLLSKMPVDFALNLLNCYRTKSTNIINGNTVRCLCMPSKKRFINEKYGFRRGRLKEWNLNAAEFEFEGIKLLGTKEYDECLRWQYGDKYMVPPPENERGQHAPVSSYSL